MNDHCFKTPITIVASVQKLLENYISFLVKENPWGNHDNAQWTSPPTSVLKVNSDIAYCASSKIAGLGVVERDSRGEVCFCAITKRMDVQSPLQAELPVALFEMEIARGNNFQSVHLKLDSKVVVTEILKKAATFCSWGSIIVDICSILRECEGYSVNYVCRGMNSFAHNLSKLANEFDVFKFWWKEIPPNFYNPNVLWFNEVL